MDLNSPLLDTNNYTPDMREHHAKIAMQSTYYFDQGQSLAEGMTIPNALIFYQTNPDHFSLLCAW